MTCEGSLALFVGGERAASSAGGGCGTAPYTLRAVVPTVLAEPSIDGVPIPVRAAPFRIDAAVATAAALAAGSALFPLAGWIPLVAMPPITWAPHYLGLPIAAAAWVVAGAALALQGTLVVGWRRALAWGAMGVTVWLAARAVLAEKHDADVRVGALVYSMVDVPFLQRKVDAVVRRLQAEVGAGELRRPLILALGSSSSGGGTTGRYWPQVVAEEIPAANVISAAAGGATSWHMRRIVEITRLRPDLCIFYMGHNDRLRTFPGLTIAQLEAGRVPMAGSWSSPVSLDEARANVTAISQACGATLAMEEHSRSLVEVMAAYGVMLASIPGVRHADARGMLAAGSPSAIMLDDVHPSPRGQEMLGKFVAVQARGMLGLVE